jgi:protein-tyrosine phosphatase
MTFGRIDVHSHLLPGVDDGCPSLDEALQCAQMMVDAGYTHAFCTPHVWPNLPGQTRESIPKWTSELQSALSTAGIPLQLLPGSELNLHPAVMQTAPDRIVSVALAGKYILVDIWMDKLPDWFEPAIRWLQEMKLTVILAHPERMRAVQDDPRLGEHFTQMGMLLQGNLQCFADHPDSYTRRTAEKYLLENRYLMLGSDTHNVEGLRHRLKGLQNAINLAGNDVIDKLTRVNPRMLLPQ